MTLRTGLLWEADVAAALDTLQKTRQIDAWKKTAAEAVHTGGRPRFKAAGPADYRLKRGGAVIMLEAKVCSMPRLQWARVEPSQVESLESAHFGALLCLFTSGADSGRGLDATLPDCAVAIDWAHVRDEWRRWKDKGGRPASLTLARARSIGVVEGTGYGCPASLFSGLFSRWGI